MTHDTEPDDTAGDRTGSKPSGAGQSDTEPGLTVSERYRQRFFRITSDGTLTTDEKIRRMLELGRSRLDVENAHVVEIDREAGTHEVTYASGSDLVEAGTVSNLEETFCRKTIDSDGLLAVFDATDGEWADDPAAKWGIGCYIGGKILVEDDLYGTLCFVGRDPRPEPFTDEERLLIDPMTRWLGRAFERDAHERRSRKQQEEYRLLVDAVSDYAVFTLDPDGTVRSWNPAARRVKQYEEDEIVGESFSTFFPEEARRAGRPARLLALAARDGIVEDEGWRVRKDGSTFWALTTLIAQYDDDDELRGFGKITRDLTEQRDVQQALEAEREFSKQTLDALEDIIFVVNPDGEIDRVNQQAVEVTGYSREKLRSMDPTVIFSENDRPAVADAIAVAFERGYSEVEATVETRDGERLTYEFRGRRVTDDEGAVTGVAGVGRDVTDQRMHEQRLEVAQRMLRHNLRNDLNVIQGYAEMLAGDSETPDAADKISKTADKLLDMAEKTRTMTDVETREIGSDPVDIVELVHRLLEEFQAEHDGVELEIEGPVGLGVVKSNGEYIETAVRNVVENAIEHNDAARPRVRVEMESTTDGVRITVHDNGPGIPADEREVLERGEETPLTHGSGLGLWLIHWCMNTAGGFVTFEEREPTGSIVTLEFPVTRPD